MRILILSYHYPPLNVIASNRAHAFFKYLLRFGFEVDLVTLDWQEKNGGVEAVRGEGFRVEETPGGRIFRLRVSEAPAEGETVRWKIIRNWVMGYFDEGLASLHGAGRCFDAFVEQQVQRDSYDAIIGIFSPHQHLRTCARIHKKFGIPYVLDFRDLWSNRVLHEAYSPRLAERLQDAAVRFHWRKWMKHALFFTTVSAPHQAFLSSLTSQTGYAITNGFDADDFPPQVTKRAGDPLQIAHIGTLYESQDLRPFLEGFRRFADEHPGAKAHFVGGDVPSWGRGLTARKREVRSYLETFLKPEQFELSERLPRTEALQILQECDLCYFPSFPGVKGTYSGKFFEYLGSGKPILSVPADHGVVDEAMERCAAGRVASTAAAVYQFLSEFAAGEYKHELKQEAVDAFSREATVRRLAEHLHRHLAEAKKSP